jgi:phosphohistidine phosphatase
VQVLVVRHAVALDRAEAADRAVPDSERPLTAEGRARMKQAARGLAKRLPEVGALLSSPLLRARETAAILRERYRGLDCTESEALLPEAEPQALEQALLEHAQLGLVAVVGHEPHLSGWVSWCLTGEQRPLVVLRKAGACLLRFDGPVSAGGGQLQWLLTSALARRLG